MQDAKHQAEAEVINAVTEFQETVEVPQVESADHERQVPMITMAEFVDPETVDERESCARGYVSPRVCLP